MLAFPSVSAGNGLLEQLDLPLGEVRFLASSKLLLPRGKSIEAEHSGVCQPGTTAREDLYMHKYREAIDGPVADCAVDQWVLRRSSENDPTNPDSCFLNSEEIFWSALHQLSTQFALALSRESDSGGCDGTAFRP